MEGPESSSLDGQASYNKFSHFQALLFGMAIFTYIVDIALGE